MKTVQTVSVLGGFPITPLKRGVNEGSKIQRLLVLSGLQLLNGLEDGRFIHFVGLKSGSDSVEQSNGQLPAEVFAKFCKALENDEITTGIDVQQFVGINIETEGLNQPQNAVCAGGVKKAQTTRIYHVK